MVCDVWREAISAIADGEEPGVDRRLLDAHLAHCDACRSFRDAVAGAIPIVRFHVAAPMPDLSKRISRLAAIADRTSGWTVARALLAAVAIEIIVLSLPALILGDEHATSAHSARHLGAFTVAYGVGLLVVVVRPARARTMLPVAAVLAGALLITAVIDLLGGHVPLLGETQHLPEVLSVLLVWLLAVPTPRRSGWTLRRSHERAPLHVVDKRDAS